MTPRQQLILDLVRRYKEQFPDEYKLHCKEVKWERSNQLDKGFTKDKSMRKAISFPVKLYQRLDYALGNPSFMKGPEGEKELRWLAKKLPEFCIPNTI